MPLPQQTFSTIAQLIAYINQFIVPNANQEIIALEHNNIENALANFVVFYTLNSGKINIVTTTAPKTLSSPMTLFTAVSTAVQWPDNVQNEYYVINATLFNINCAGGFSYYDISLVNQTVFPARTVIHMALAPNGFWYQVNNIGGTSGAVDWNSITGKPQTFQFMWVVDGPSNFASLPGAPTPPPSGSTTLVSALIAGFAVRVSRGGIWQLAFDPTSGNSFYTKVDNASDTVTFTPALQALEEMIVETIPL